jgi:hypothetical protein
MAGSYTKMSDEKKYMAEADLGTLIEAEKIKKDKPRWNAAMKCKQEKMAAMQSLDGKAKG